MSSSTPTAVRSISDVIDVVEVPEDKARLAGLERMVAADHWAMTTAREAISVANYAIPSWGMFEEAMRSTQQYLVSSRFADYLVQSARTQIGNGVPFDGAGITDAITQYRLWLLDNLAHDAASRGSNDTAAAMNTMERQATIVLVRAIERA